LKIHNKDTDEDILQNSQNPKEPKYTDAKKADLNTLVHYIADQNSQHITEPGHLKQVVLLGYELAQLCKQNIAMLVAANNRAMLTTLANAAIALDMKGDTLEDYSKWWYSEDWRGKQGQAPSPKSIIETWGQFEAAKINPPVNNGPTLSEAQKARLAELTTQN